MYLGVKTKLYKKHGELITEGEVPSKLKHRNINLFLSVSDELSLTPLT